MDGRILDGGSLRVFVLRGCANERLCRAALLLTQGNAEGKQARQVTEEDGGRKPSAHGMLRSIGNSSDASYTLASDGHTRETTEARMPAASPKGQNHRNSP